VTCAIRLLRIVRQSTPTRNIVLVDHQPKILRICNDGKMEKWKFTKKSTLKLCNFMEKISIELLKKPVDDMSERELLYMADSITRSSLIQVLHNKLSSGIFLLNQAYILFETLSRSKPDVRYTLYYQVMMWHRACIYPKPPLIQEAYEWAINLKEGAVVEHIVFVYILATCFPELYRGESGAPRKPTIPSQSQIPHLLFLWDKLQDAITHSIITKVETRSHSSIRILSNAAMCALRNWILGDIEEAAKDVEECAIQTSILCYPLMDVLPVKIAMFVSIELLGLHIYPIQPERGCLYEKELKEQVKKVRRLVHLTEMLKKLGDTSLIRVWTLVVDSFIHTLFQTFCKDMICKSYSSVPCQ